MKITGRKSIQPTSPLGGPVRVGPTERVEKSDRMERVEERAADVELSSGLREVEKAVETVKTMSDVRVEKVEELKPLVDDGSYKVESRVLAKRIVDSSLRESAHMKSGRKS
jgi:flagellar biosynthesis anti-sigma factor FlgM